MNEINITEKNYTIEINPTESYVVELNEQGPQGLRGFTGNGIESYIKTSSSGLTDTYTITFTDGNTTTVDVTNGRGITSITGPVSVDNIDTYTINYNDSTASTFTVTNGIDGVNPTVTVGSTTTSNPGTDASVVNSGTIQDVILDFTIPRGDKGETGDDGADGFSPIATVSKVGDTATISITDINGTTTTTISDGTDGVDGAAATIAVGTVTTGLPTDPASVTNVGTSSEAIFDFTIPKGNTGDTGATGNGIINTEKVSTVGLVDTYHINYTNGNYDTFTVTNGQNGTGSVADVLVNGTSVLDGQDAKILIKTINSNSITGSGNLDVGTVTSVNNVAPVSGDVTLTASDVGAYASNNPSGYITSSALIPYALSADLASVATSGSYNDLSNKPAIPDISDLANKDLSNLSSTGEAKFQAPLVSGTNIKTLNGNSILGNGDLTLDGLPSQTGQSGKFLTTDGTDASWGNLPVATSSTVGVVKPDNASIRVSNDGTISAICRNVGEIIPSTLPLTDAGLHLLDGSLLQYGIYKEFIDYIAELYTQDPTANYWTTESAWQSSVSTYGSCGKFVYDSTNNTVRLPKVTGKIDGTTDINALGNLEPLFVRLPNITGTFAMGKAGQSYNGHTSTGAFYDGGDTLSGNNAQSGGVTRLFGFNASRSSSVYSGNGSNTAIHEQAIKMFVYIVIANSTKTDIQVDIDQVATDLNGKADTDLTNTTNQGYIKMAGASMPSGTYIDLTLGASGSQYTAPANGWYYLNKLYGGNNLFTKLINITRGYAVNNTFHSTSNFNCDLLLPIKKGDVISVDYNTPGAVQVFRFYYAVGSESEV